MRTEVEVPLTIKIIGYMLISNAIPVCHNLPQEEFP